jgi:hypothetical protein
MRTLLMKTCLRTLVAALGFTALAASAQTKWDMPTPTRPRISTPKTSPSSPPTSTRPRPASSRSPSIPAGSLFKANEIKRAVQGGQAQIGEILLGGYANENPLFGTDNVPFLATSYAEARKLAAAQKPALDALLAKQG